MNARMHLSGAHASQQRDESERLAVAVEVLGLLADRTRLALLRRLGEGEADVTTLTEAAEATRTSVSGVHREVAGHGPGVILCAGVHAGRAGQSAV
ncbi:hypothetical protein ACWEQN_47400, partial [Streptomyces sp. NPDC004129]